SGLPATSSITLGMRTLRGWMRRPEPPAASTPIRGAATSIVIRCVSVGDKRRTRAASPSHVQPLEDTLGDQANPEHERAPERRHVAHLRTTFGVTDDRRGGGLGRGQEKGTETPEGHPGIDEAELYRGDRHAVAMQSRAQTLQIGVEARLRRPVDVVARPA